MNKDKMAGELSKLQWVLGEIATQIRIGEVDELDMREKLITIAGKVQSLMDELDPPQHEHLKG